MTHAIMMILTIAFAATLLNRARCRRAGSSVGDGSIAEAAALRDEVRMLKGRIATLERIATDRPSALDREIEALRDRP